MSQLFSQFMTDENGSTAIEYGLIAAILAVAIVSSLTSIKAGFITLTTNVIDGLRG